MNDHTHSEQKILKVPNLINFLIRLKGPLNLGLEHSDFNDQMKTIEIYDRLHQGMVNCLKTPDISTSFLNISDPLYMPILQSNSTTHLFKKHCKMMKEHIPLSLFMKDLPYRDMRSRSQPLLSSRSLWRLRKKR